MAQLVKPTNLETRSRIMSGPPTVGFQQEQCAAGAGGVCLVIFEQLCYDAGIVITCGVSWPALCIVVGVGAAAYAICLAAGTSEALYKQGRDIIAAEEAKRNQQCLDAPSPPGETVLQNLARLAACYADVKAWVKEALETLLTFLYGRNRGLSPSTSNPGGSGRNKPQM